MVNALKAKTFAAKYFDPNYPTTLPSGKFYTFSWKCTNSFYNRPCATTDGTAVESSSTLTYAIPAKTFQVYQSYTI